MTDRKDTPAASGAAPADSRVSVASILRAMALNYTARHSWDHLDADACRKGADEIDRLAALASREASPALLNWTDQEIEACARSRGCKWHSDGYWVFEDSDLHPFVRSLLALASPQVAPALTLEVLREILVKHDRSLPVACAEEILASAAMGAESEPVAFVNRDELDNMLNDRTATIQGQRSGWRKTALYLATPVQVAPTKVYLVATGEVVDGLETYTRHDGVPPPLCDSELLYSAPVALQDDARDAAEVWNEAIEAAARRIEGGSFLHDQAPAKLFANQLAPVIRSMKRTPAAKPTEPTLPTQGEQSHD